MLTDVLSDVDIAALRASGISDAVIAERGYRSILTVGTTVLLYLALWVIMPAGAEADTRRPSRDQLSEEFRGAGERVAEAGRIVSRAAKQAAGEIDRDRDAVEDFREVAARPPLHLERRRDDLEVVALQAFAHLAQGDLEVRAEAHRVEEPRHLFAQRAADLGGGLAECLHVAEAGGEHRGHHLAQLDELALDAPSTARRPPAQDDDGGEVSDHGTGEDRSRRRSISAATRPTTSAARRNPTARVRTSGAQEWRRTPHRPVPGGPVHRK